MYKIAILLICVTVFSCGNDKQSGDSISMEDFAGETGEIVDENTEVFDTIPADISGPLNQFLKSQLAQFDTLSHSKFNPIDRFTYSQKLKIEFKSKTDVPYGKDKTVTPKAAFFYYSFSDSTKTKNAFYNWLDCFGTDCQQIKLFDDSSAIKMPPSFIMVYDTVILVADYRCEDDKFNWSPFQDSLKAKFGRSTRYELKVKCGGPIKWN